MNIEMKKHQHRTKHKIKEEVEQSNFILKDKNQNV